MKMDLLIGNKLVEFCVWQAPHVPICQTSLYILGRKNGNGSLEIVSFGLSEHLDSVIKNNKGLNIDLVLTHHCPTFRYGLVLLGKMELKEGQTLVYDLESRLEDMQ